MVQPQLQLESFGEMNMEWDRLLSRERLGKESESTQPRPGRSEFDSDDPCPCEMSLATFS
jgi:hypothetical protein